MSYKLTKEQAIASDPSHSVWVTANAGTGKTKILVDRVLRLLLNGTHPNEILCITFTKAAAAEMAQRINETLSDWVTSSDQELEESLTNLTGKKPTAKIKNTAIALFARIIDHPEDLKIQTIHSLCQSILKRFPLEAENTSPNFTIVEGQNEQELLKLSWQRLLSGLSISTAKDPRLKAAIKYTAINQSEVVLSKTCEELIGNRAKFLALLDHYKGKEKLIKQIYRSLNSKENFDREAIIASACQNESFRANEMKRLLGEFKLYSGDSKTNENTFAAISKWISSSPEERVTFINEYIHIFVNKSGEEKALTSIVTKKAQEKLSSSAISCVEMEQKRILQISEDINNLNIAKQTEALVHIGESILTIYSDLKAERGYLDNNDLIHETERLLEKSDISPWIMYKLDQATKHILVDESQDTSPAQWNIIKHLCSEFYSGEGQHGDLLQTLFAVGDEKQSIFSFQGADPKEFAKVKIYFAEQNNNADQSLKDIMLSLSFRSSTPIVDTVDATFTSNLMTAVSNSSKKMRHDTYRKNGAGLVELWPVVKVHNEVKKFDGEWELPLYCKEVNSAEVILADQISETISSWLKDKRILYSKNRPIEPRDILILVKSRKYLVNCISKSLKKNNVPVAGVDRMSLMDHIAVIDLVSLGKFLLLKDDSLSLANILKSPICNLSEDELFEIATHDTDSSLWSNMEKLSVSSESILQCFKLLSDFVDKHDMLSVYDFYSYVVDVVSIRDNYVKRMGNEVHDPLNEFLNLALQFGKRNNTTLQCFVEWIGTGNIEIKRDFIRGNNEIRIMTIHGAKGLQAPIVILPDTIHSEINKNYLKWVGGNAPCFIWDTGNKSQISSKINDQKKQADYEEGIRLLYVAMTRAEDELYVCAYKNNSHSIPEKSWYSVVKNGIEKIANSNLQNENGETVYRIEKLPLDTDNVNYNVTEEEDRIEKPQYLQSKPKLELVSADPLPSSSEKPTVSKDTERGILMHKLLEVLPQFPAEERVEVAKRYTGANEAIISEAISVIENKEFSFIFDLPSKNEVPIIGKIDDSTFAGRIDRLVIDNDKIHIIDYKTSKKPPNDESEIPDANRKQMAVYKEIIAEIYPDKEVSCYLLWTNSLRLMKLKS